MEKLGFVIAGEIDHWFLAVDLPPDWYKAQDHGHPGWWMICDDLDRLRCQCMEGSRNFAGIVANWQRRYDYDVQWHPHDPCRQRWVILDGGDIVHETEWCVGRRDRLAQFTYSNFRSAVRWLNARYPKWRDLLAYWD